VTVVLITGSSGLIGSECARYFDGKGLAVHGVDNNMRRDFFGPDGDTSRVLGDLSNRCRHFTHHDLDIRNRQAIIELFGLVRPSLVIHCAAQPSHDLAASRPFDDFDVNAGGTLNMLEAARRTVPDSVFCHMSTNKVYGDAPNQLSMVELETRWEYASPFQRQGIDETMSIDQNTHSLFGASKVAADILVQEYGRYFGLKTVCFRGGCLTGSAHAAAEQHGFLAYLAKCVREGRHYRVFGYKGKQVRDNLHAYDVCRAMDEFFQAPRPGEVYNLGGGRANSISVLEAIERLQSLLERKLSWEYVDRPRIGDHICYYSNLAKFQSHYPRWQVSRSLDDILADLTGVPKLTATVG
jgi:CDP-paratose 2-epimerase